MATELQLEAFREWFTGKYTYSAEYFQLAHFDIERGFFKANDGRNPSAVDAAWVLTASFDAWQHQQAVIDMERAKKDELQKKVDRAYNSIDKWWHPDVDQKLFIESLEKILRGEHD